MQAVWYEENGPARQVLTVGEIDAPEPGAGEVRVRLAVSGVNPVDVKRRRGGRGPMPAPRVVPHFDGAGTIDKVGPDVPASRVGERVWLYEATWQRALGTAAEAIAVAADRAVPLPDNVDFATGACFGIPAMTAHRCVFADGAVAGRMVLVTGGAGAVGAYAVQFARLGGARVIATVSSDEKAEVARRFGADIVLNYRTEDVAGRVRDETGGAGIDRIVEVDFAANLPVSLAVLKENGVIATYASDSEVKPAVPFYDLVYRNATVHHVLVFSMPEDAKAQAIADITRWSSDGSLLPHIGPRFPLAQTADAHEAVERGALGNVVVAIGGD